MISDPSDAAWQVGLGYRTPGQTSPPGEPRSRSSRQSDRVVSAGAGRIPSAEIGSAFAAPGMRIRTREGAVVSDLGVRAGSPFDGHIHGLAQPTLADRVELLTA